jgi:hypothetical protein
MQRGGAVVPPKSQTNAVKPNSTRANGAAVASPLVPRKLDEEVTKRGRNTQNTSTIAVNAIRVSQASMSELYTCLCLRVPTFNRFADRWNAIGSITGQVLTTQYNPTTFVSDFIRDMTTPEQSMDRPTAVQTFGAIVHYLRYDDTATFKLRAAWVHAFCSLVGEDIPAPFDAASVGHGLHEGDRPSKRRPSSHPPNPNSSTDSEMDELSDSMSDSNLSGVDPNDPVAVIKALPTLNAATVWGVDAGFTIVPHERILAIHRQKAQDALAANINSVKSASITWPRLKSWTKESWYAFDKAWWDCNNEAVNSGAYSTMMSLIDLNLHDDIQLDLEIDADKWFETQEIDFLRKAHGHWGPQNKEEALILLRHAHVHVRKGSCPPQIFLNILSNYNTTFLRILDLQIAPSIRKWPDRDRPEYGLLELKQIRKVFKKSFSACKEISPACKHCYVVVDQNPLMSHRTLYAELRLHFQDDVKSLSRQTMNGGSVQQSSNDNEWE